MKRRIFTPLLLLSGLALSGCGLMPWSVTAQVPTDSSVRQGEVSGSDQQDQFIRVIPQGPRSGMTAVQVVQGFLDASAAAEDDHGVAREYLTAEAAARWMPDSGVQVFKGTPELTLTGTTVLFSAPLVGKISEKGSYAITQGVSTLSAKFSLVRQEGQWRIEQLPQGLQLSTVDMQRAYRSLSVFYFNPQLNTLVPDSRMIAVPGNGLATGLMEALLSGPSEWLAPAVRNAFALGVGLNFRNVPVESGVARVDLTADAGSATDETRRQMAQQIVWTMRQVPEVRAVAITAGGQNLTISATPYPIPRDQWPQIDPSGLAPEATAVVASWSGVQQLTRQSSARIAGNPKVANSALVQVESNRTGGMLAAIDVLGRVWSTTVDSSPTWSQLPITRAVQWLEFDPSGGLWIWNEASGLAVWDAPGPLKSIPIQGLPAGSTLLKAVPSRDGSRAALIVRLGSKTALYLARIVQNVETNARTISEPKRVARSVSELVDVDWSGANSLAFIGRSGAGVLQVFDLDLALGILVAQGGPDSPDSIASAPGLPVLISAKNGLIYQLDAGSWTSRLNAWSPSYPS